MRSDFLKTIKCTISRGGFSDERVFTLSNGYEGVASRQYFWRDDGRALEEGEPPIDQRIEGWVAVRIVEVREPGPVLVALPDGESIEVSLDVLTSRPRVGEHVPVGS